jgi:hypothetical protein
MYGLYDTQDDCWMGNDQGPLLYEDEDVAKVGAQVLDVRLKQKPGRTRAKPFAKESLVKKDERETFVRAEEAIARLEKEQ